MADYIQPCETPEEIAARLGVSIECGREHQGEHRCIDGRRYVTSCLVSDPTCDRIARRYYVIGDSPYLPGMDRILRARARGAE